MIPIAAKFCMDVKTHVKSIATNFVCAENEGGGGGGGGAIL